jgi:hypothetical protein
MLKKMQDHRNVDALFLAVSLAANLRADRRVQNRTNMRKAPDKTRPVMYRLSKCLIVRTRQKPNTNAPGAAQKAWASSFPLMELVFIAAKERPVQAATKRLMLRATSNVPTKMASVLSILARVSLV